VPSRLPADASLPAGGAEMLQLLWTLPYPALWLDRRFAIVDVNEAFVQFSGFDREALRGVDPLSLHPPEDQPAEREARALLQQALAAGGVSLSDRRLLDGHGRERWYRATYTPMGGAGMVSVLQDTTSEHAARAHADRSLNELAQWFDISPSGMLVFDASGLIVRSNRAFEGLVGRMPVGLSEAGPDLQALLGWQDGKPHPDLQPGAQPLERHVLLALPGGAGRWLSARLSAFATELGERRFMAVVQDHSAEEERDLAQLEIGALMDTAGIGVATYDSHRGWLHAPAPERPDRADGATAGPSALQGIAREMVEPGSLADYERLQSALRAGERAEVRYAVRHPELGQRWLLTRVEPGALAGGRRATSVVTLDVTDRERAQRRNEQLLRELSTIMDGSTAGVAYLRGAVLVRCNRRFERMLGLSAGTGAGATVEEMFALGLRGGPVAREATAALQAGRDFEGEFAYDDGRQGPRWYTLELRPAPSDGSEPEAVAVLTDITRLKVQQAELESLLRDRELMFSLSEVGIVYQRGARIERANQAMAELTGYSTPELTALDAAELYASARECVDFERALYAGLRRDGRFVGERRLRRRDGRLLWVQVAARPVDAERPEDGVVCSFVDVDERHRARESLQQQALRTRAILDSVLVGIVTVEHGGIEWMNRSARRMFGGELADFVGEPIGIVATAEPAHPLRRTDWLDRLTEGQAETFECRLQGRDGREFWVAGNAVVTAREGRGRQLTFALLDIDGRRRAEVSIAQTKASLQRVIETAPLAIALLDGEHRQVLQGNANASAFLSAPPAGLSDALAAAAATTEPQRRELQQPPQGDAPGRWWDTRIVTLPAGPDEAPQLLLVASDVTEQRAADQARLEAAIAQREVLVKEVHHRIKNNLQGVAGLLQQFAARRPDVAPALGEAVSQVQAIAQVYGLQVGATGPLRLARVVEAIVQSVRRTFGRAIGVEAGEGVDAFVLPEAESIPIALSLNELLTNTVKHGDDGPVHCRVWAEDDGVAIEMRHRGRLPPAFDLGKFPGGVSGLGLVRALLPRRSATLSLTQAGDAVLTRVVLRPPGVRREPAGSATIPAMAAQSVHDLGA
jgi:PAS domain S-box-containing protein